MTVREVIQRIKNLYSKGTPSDDSRLTDRHVYSKLVTVRSRLITQELNRRKKVSNWNYQVLPCVELIEVPRHECPCLPEIGCRILRSKYKLPKPLVGHNNHIITSVASVDGSIVYSETSFEAKKYKGGNRYTSSKPDYYIRGGYLYITHRLGPRIISITGLFEDPAEAEKYPMYCSEGDSHDDKGCVSPLDGEFPIEADMLDALIEMSLNELVLTFSQMPEDRSNNSSDNPVEQSK